MRAPRAFGIGSRVGRRVKELREEHELTQDDVARAVRRAGVSWRQTSVAALESGQRRLTLEEFLGLGVALRQLTGKDVSVAFSGDGAAEIHLGGRPVRAILPAEQREALAGMKENTRALRVWPEAKQSDLEAAHADSAGDAEQKAARRFRERPVLVALAARRLWKRSLTEERDRRVTADASVGSTPRRVQGLRGHVTRALLEELAPVVSLAKSPRVRARG
jgi:transcriptional regulator with XRE-family HTH domain